MQRSLVFFVLFTIIECFNSQAKELKWSSDAEGGAPFVYFSPHTEKGIKGFEVDLIKLFEEEIKQKFLYVQNDWDFLIQGLRRDLYELVLCGLERTPAHEQNILFSEIYLYSSYRIVIAQNNKSITRWEDLRYKMVGILKNTQAQVLLEDLKEVKEVRHYMNEVTAYEDLKIGRIEAVLLDEPTALYYAAPDPKLKLLPVRIGRIEYAAAFNPKNEVLCQQFNEFLKKIKQNGQLQRLLEDWNLWTPQCAQFFKEEGQNFPNAYHRFIQENKTSIDWNNRIKLYTRALPLIFKATVLSLYISVWAMLLAITLGMSFALIRVYGPWYLQSIVFFIIEILRGTPLLIQLLLIFYGLPTLGIKLSPFFAGVLGLGINYSAYEAEIYRSGIHSVALEQMEAARALGMTHFQALRYVILPQAIRNVIPPVTNDFISLLKDSSLVSVITLVELTKTYMLLAATYYDYCGLGILISLFYLIIGFPFVAFSRWIERHLLVQNGIKKVRRKGQIHLI